MGGECMGHQFVNLMHYSYENNRIRCNDEIDDKPIKMTIKIDRRISVNVYSDKV